MAPTARRCACFLLALLVVLAAAVDAPARSRPAANPYALAGGCFGMRSTSSLLFVRRSGGGYAATARSVSAAYRLRMQATALGRYLLVGPDHQLVAAGGDDTVVPAGAPSEAAVWRVRATRARSFVLVSSATGRELAVAPDGHLIQVVPLISGPRARFTFRRGGGCAVPANAQVDARGRAFHSTSAVADVRGTIDAHTHLTAFEFIGGDFHCGRPWHPFGVTFALPDCASIQGPRGSAAPVQNFLDFGEPVHPHDTVGWPTFRDWPGPTRLSYEGTYYTGLRRAWLAGLRLMVTDLVDNEALCSAMPKKHNPCNDMSSVRIQARALRGLQDYIDAQSGGPGKGWFRIVTNPFQARRAISQGKLAVVEGVEVSRIFDCGEHNHVPECSRSHVDAGLREVRRLGVSSFYPVHKFDNAFGGTKMDAGSLGLVINGGNHTKTGHFWNVKTCTGRAHDSQQLTPAMGAREARRSIMATPIGSLLPGDAVPVYPPAPHCNQQGLTSLGAYLIEKMIDQHFIIEIDHMDVKTGDKALSLLEKRHYSGVVSPHNWSSPEQYPRIYRAGGFITPIAGTSPEGFVSQWRDDRKMRSRRFKFGFGYGSDMNGLAHQSEPTNRRPISYPFRSFTGQVKFDRERWGQRVFDLNRDGVANYGMYADWLQELRLLGGRSMMRDMFQGAEAYLQTWERAFGVPAPRCRPAGERFSSAGLGHVRLGASARSVLYRAGQPSSRPGRSFRWCVRGGGRAVAVFSRARGRVAFVASTARGARAGGIGPGANAAALGGRRERSGPHGSLFLYGVQAGRVRWVAVVAAREARSGRRVRADVRAAGL